MKNRKLLTIDENDIMAAIEVTALKIKNSLGIH
jgi:hypothetical protein